MLDINLFICKAVKMFAAFCTQETWQHSFTTEHQCAIFCFTTEKIDNFFENTTGYFSQDFIDTTREKGKIRKNHHLFFVLVELASSFVSVQFQDTWKGRTELIILFQNCDSQVGCQWTKIDPKFGGGCLVIFSFVFTFNFKSVQTSCVIQCGPAQIPKRDKTSAIWVASQFWSLALLWIGQRNSPPFCSACDVSVSYRALNGSGEKLWGNKMKLIPGSNFCFWVCPPMSTFAMVSPVVFCRKAESENATLWLVYLPRRRSPVQ